MRALKKTFTEPEGGAPAGGTCAQDDFSEHRQESLDVWVICLELLRASREKREEVTEEGVRKDRGESERRGGEEWWREVA